MTFVDLLANIIRFSLILVIVCGGGQPCTDAPACLLAIVDVFREF